MEPVSTMDEGGQKNHESDQENGVSDAMPKTRGVKRARAPPLGPEHLKNPMGFAMLHDNFLTSFRKKSKGPGHELHDLELILTMYELWQRRMYNYCDLDEFLKKTAKLAKKKEIQEWLGHIRTVLGNGPSPEPLEQEGDVNKEPVRNLDAINDDELLEMQKEDFCGDEVPEDFLFGEVAEEAFDDLFEQLGPPT